MKKNIKGKLVYLSLLVLLTLTVLPLFSQTFENVQKRISEFTLKNGLKFIVYENHAAPVVSFHVYVDAGAANESYGITGISHLLEHMAFKGTKTIGTKNYAEESKYLDRLDKLYNKIIREKYLVTKTDSVKLASMEKEFAALQEKAKGYVINNDMFDIFMRQGDRGMNAFTSNDATQYVNSLPENRLEFWMSVTSDRFMNPVFREFYKEKNVVMEERRLTLESRPIGRLLEDFMAASFKAHPYHHSVVGHMSDLLRITRTDVKNHFAKYYIPSNMVIGIAGDVKLKEVKKLAKVYFERIPSVPKPEGPRTVEPEQWGERIVTVVAKSQPILLVGYHRPNGAHPDNAALDALANIIGQGRSSWLYKDLVKEKKIAVQVGAFNGLPGTKYPCLIAFFAVPAQGHDSDECLKAIDEFIEKIKTTPVSDKELEKYKRTQEVDFIDQLKSNSSIAMMLTNAEVLDGSWKEAFNSFEKINAVTADDIMRVAKKYLLKNSRTIGKVVPEDSKKDN